MTPDPDKIPMAGVILPKGLLGRPTDETATVE